MKGLMALNVNAQEMHRKDVREPVSQLCVTAGNCTMAGRALTHPPVRAEGGAGLALLLLELDFLSVSERFISPWQLSPLTPIV